jgi:hypothetical protein
MYIIGSIKAKAPTSIGAKLTELGSTNIHLNANG